MEPHISVRSAVNSSRSYAVPIPASDIDSRIRFSRLRSILCICSLLLACSDIPRTGIGVRHLRDILTPITPDTGFFFGPYAYPVAHIAKATSHDNSSEYNGSADGSPITSTTVWSYKFDTVSIPLRAFVQQLRIQSTWPPCVLYLERCQTKKLPLGETFVMLDSLISAVHGQLFTSQVTGSTSLPWVMAVESNWVDRVHQYLFTLLGAKPQQSRMISVHYFQLPANSSAVLAVCDSRVPNTHRPLVCDLNIPWTCGTTSVENSDFSFPTSHISLSRHLAIRIAMLRRKYPLLYFDVAMFTTYFVRSNSNDRRPSRWAFFRSETIEVMTAIRGRSCSSSGSEHRPMLDADCDTVFVDDYRYERATLQTDVAQWFVITSTLRTVSQTYMLLRVTALWLGCYTARSSEPKFADTSLWLRIGKAWATFFRIPGQIIVYSSWLPVVGYAFAHLVDTAVVQITTDILGGSINGAQAYDFWTYIKAAMVQMRNIWYFAVVVKVFVLLQVHCLPKRWILRHGLLHTRGTWLGWMSACTVLGPYRAIAFRDSNVVRAIWLSPAAMRPVGHMISYCEHVSDFGIRLDAKMVGVVILGTLVIVFVSNRNSHKGQRLFNTLIFSLTDHRRGRRTRSEPGGSIRFFSRSHYLPLSVGTLFDASSLSIFWQIKLIGIAQKNYHLPNRSTVVPVVSRPHLLPKQPAIGPSSRLITCKECSVAKTRWDWPSSQGCPDHDDIYRIDRRSEAVWSMVRLINLTMMSDPLVWIQLRVFGRRLYLYEMSSDHAVVAAGELLEISRAKVLVLLPCNPKQLADELEVDGLTLTLVDIVDSASVPWSLLLQCG